MDVGMLWFDADPRSAVAAKIERAAAYYQSKYGRHPTLCFLNPATAGGLSAKAVAGLDVHTSQAVLPEHFWLGVGEQVKEPPKKIG